MTDDSSRLRAPGETPGTSTTGTPIDTERLRALLAAGPFDWNTVDGINSAFGHDSFKRIGAICELLEAVPGLLDEVELGRRDEVRLIAARAEIDRLGSESDDWLRMYLEAVRVFRTTCLDVAKRIEAGGSLADVVDLVGNYMDNGLDGLLDDETVDLLLRAKAVTNGEATPRAEAEGQQAMTWAEAHDELGDLDFTAEPAPTPAEDRVVDLMAALEQSVNDAKAARRRKLDEATPDTEGEG